MLRSGGLRLLRLATAASSSALHPAAVAAVALNTTGQRAAHSRPHIRHRQHNDPIDPDEYTAEPQYPAIEELGFKARLLRRRLATYEHIRQLGTVEEKLLALNMPRYYGFKCLMLRGDDSQIHYDSLPLVQHSTRTVFEEGALPEAVYGPLREQALGYVEAIREDVQQAVVFETIGYRPAAAAERATATERSRALSARLVAQLHRCITNALAADVPHLRDCESDTDPRHEAYWPVGGIAPPRSVQRIKEACAWQKDYAHEPVDRHFQYVGRPLLTVRHAHPLRPHAEHAAFGAADAERVPAFAHDPRTVGYAHEHRHVVTVPGFWPGAAHEFGQLAYLSRAHLADRNPAYGAADDRQAVHAQAVLGSFAWLLGQACYQGFSVYTDPTYALATQTVVTDGQHYAFYAYQLNTTQTHQDALEAGATRVNQCWGGVEQRLYERVDADGSVHGWNDEVLVQLVQLYLNEPARRGHPMRPFLGAVEQRVAQIEEGERREWLEREYKHVASNRPRHRLVPEVYHWEKFYKIDNKTLQLAPRRRFFELGENPFARRLDEHQPTYVPKAVRPGGKKNRVGRWAKTFYPTAPAAET